MRYRVNDCVFEDIDELLDEYADEDYHWDDDYFEDWVNETYHSIYINGTNYYAYDILDHMASDELRDLREQYCEDETENDKENARYELRNADPGDTVDFQAYTIEVLDDEEPGDYDGDEGVEAVAVHAETIEAVRMFIDEQKMLQEHAEAENKKTEDDMMSLFQVIK